MSHLLKKYKGEWTVIQAAHLYRRTTFGANFSRIAQATKEGLDQTIAGIFEVGTQLPEPPIHFKFKKDEFAKVGETWVDKPWAPYVGPYREYSLRNWQFGLLIKADTIREKMTLFWHNHFVAEERFDNRFNYQYISLLRSNALGNFKDLVKKITIDPCMLRYLNGNANTTFSPNENYARELLELFTIGRGPLVGPSDYSNYTEQDVREIAKVLTGWVDIGFKDKLDTEVCAHFYPFNHNTEDKQLSHRFGNAIIKTKGGDEETRGMDEYLDLIEVIFKQAEVARFIIRKLYKWFVHPTINAETEASIIEPLAKYFRENNYEIEPVLKKLLESEHFYEERFIGSMVKSPLDFLAGFYKQFEVESTNNKETELERYNLRDKLDRLILEMQMVYFRPPDVAGWKAYYSEPMLDKIWASAKSLQLRKVFTERMASQNQGRYFYQARIPVFSIIAKFEQPDKAAAVIEEFSKLIFPRPLTTAQKSYLEDILLAGSPAYEWTKNYNGYKEDSESVKLKYLIEKRIYSLLRAMLVMPEFHLM